MPGDDTSNCAETAQTGAECESARRPTAKTKTPNKEQEWVSWKEVEFVRGIVSKALCFQLLPLIRGVVCVTESETVVPGVCGAFFLQGSDECFVSLDKKVASS